MAQNSVDRIHKRLSDAMRECAVQGSVIDALIRSPAFYIFTFDNPVNADYSAVEQSLSDKGWVARRLDEGPVTTFALFVTYGVSAEVVLAAINPLLDPEKGSAIVMRRMGEVYLWSKGPAPDKRWVQLSKGW